MSVTTDTFFPSETYHSPLPFQWGLLSCGFVVFFYFSFRDLRSRAVHVTTRSVCKNLRLPPRIVGWFSYGKLPYLIVSLNLYIFFCANHFFPKGPDRIHAVSTETPFILETNLRLLQYTLQRQEHRSLTYGCYRLLPLKVTLFLPPFFFSFFPFFLFSLGHLPVRYTRGIP